MPEKSKEMVENKDFYRNEPYIKEEKISGIRGESSADFTLPDYMGDVKRLLKFSACAIPSSKYISGGEASFLGSVIYRVEYLDSEDKLTEASFSSEYELERPLPDNCIDAALQSDVQTVSVRLGGPRKMTCRASLLHNLFIASEGEVEHKGLVKDCEMLTKEVRVHGARYFSLGARELAEELGRLDGVSSDEVEIIKCECNPIVLSADAKGSLIEIKGEAHLFAVAAIGDEIVRMEKSVPYEQSIEIEEALPAGAALSACAYCTSSFANVNNENSADGGDCYAALVMSVSLECDARADFNSVGSVVADAFLPYCVCECEYDNFAYSELMLSSFDVKSFSAETSGREWGVDKLRDVIECEAKVGAVKCEFSGEELQIVSEIAFNVVARDGGGAYLSLRCPLEYKRSVKVGNTEGCRAEIHLSPSCARLMHDGDKLYFSCNVSESVSVERDASVPYLKSISASPKQEGAAGVITVLYAAPEETVFEISKSYSIPCKTLIKCNPESLSAEFGDNYSLPLKESKKLLIIR